jgi:hypothetical protein
MADPPNASMTARIGTSVLPATMMGSVPWASIGFCTPLTDMDALPIHSVTVVDDKAAAKSTATKRTVTRMPSQCVFFTSPSLLGTATYSVGSQVQ